MEKQNWGRAELIIAMILSGTIGVFVMESGQPSYNTVFFRCLFGAICLILYCGWRGYLEFSTLNKKSLTLILVGGVCIVANWVLLFESYNHSSISISTVAYHTQPLFVVIFAAMFMKEQMQAHKVFWVCLAFAGVILIVNPSEDAKNQDQLGYGILLALSAAVLYAVATIIIKQLKGIRPHFIATIQVTLGTVLLLPLADFSIVPTVGDHWYWLFGLGLIHTCIMYILLYSAFQKVSTNTIAVLSYLYPAVAIVIDYVLYDQHLSPIQFAGITLILAAGLGNNTNVNIFSFLGSRKAVQNTEA